MKNKQELGLDLAISTNPYDYDGATRAELGFGPEVTTGALREYESPEGQRVAVYGTQPRSLGEITGELYEAPEKTIIVPASHEYRFEAENLQKQLEQIAVANDARVLFVEMPGTTGLYHPGESEEPVVHDTTDRLSGATQTATQLGSALKGDFRGHARVQLDAIDATFGLPPESHYILRGESMGAAVVTDMLDDMNNRGLKVDEVQMHEMVNAFKGTRLALPLSLMRVLPGRENDLRNIYIEENARIGHPSTAFELSGETPEEQRFRKSLDDARKSPGQQAIGGLANGLGMSKGRFDAVSRSLADIDPSNRPLLTMVRGNESLATSAEDYRHFVQQLRLGGAAVRFASVVDGSGFNVPMGHSHTFSLGRGKEIYDTLAKHH